MKLRRRSSSLPALRRRSAIEATRRHLNATEADWLLDLEIDFVVEERQGCFLHDLDHGAYLDATCDDTTFNLGHRHPLLVAKLQDSATLWDIGFPFLTSTARAAFAKELLSTVDPSLTLSSLRQ